MIFCPNNCFTDRDKQTYYKEDENLNWVICPTCEGTGFIETEVCASLEAFHDMLVETGEVEVMEGF